MVTYRAINVALGWSLALALAAAGCGSHYRAPDVPRNQLASVSVDPRATLLSVDGLAPPPAEHKRDRYNANEGDPQLKFLVGAGCRVFRAKYKESYTVWGEKKAVRKGLGHGLGPALANTEVHTYETLTPIDFFVPVRAGYAYWVTATFTGDQFLPRVVESGPSGEATARFEPNVPCPRQ